MEDGNGYTEQAIEGYKALLSCMDVPTLEDLANNVHEDLLVYVLAALSALI